MSPKHWHQTTGGGIAVAIAGAGLVVGLAACGPTTLAGNATQEHAGHPGQSTGSGSGSHLTKTSHRTSGAPAPHHSLHTSAPLRTSDRQTSSDTDDGGMHHRRNPIFRPTPAPTPSPTSSISVTPSTPPPPPPTAPTSTPTTNYGTHL